MQSVASMLAVDVSQLVENEIVFAIAEHRPDIAVECKVVTVTADALILQHSTKIATIVLGLERRADGTVADDMGRRVRIVKPQ